MLQSGLVSFTVNSWDRLYHSHPTMTKTIPSSPNPLLESCHTLTKGSFYVPSSSSWEDFGDWFSHDSREDRHHVTCGPKRPGTFSLFSWDVCSWKPASICENVQAARERPAWKGMEASISPSG